MAISRIRLTRIRAGSIGGPYGGNEPDWTTAASEEMRAVMWPVSSTEDVVNQQRTETRWRALIFGDADVLAVDRFTYDGRTFEVDGEVEKWPPGPTVHHTELVLHLVAGG